MTEGAVRLREIAKKAQIIAKKLEAWQKIKDQPTLDIPRLEKSLATIKTLLNNFPAPEIKTELLNWLTNEEDLVKKAKEEFRFQFGNQLKELCAKDGFFLKGQLPLLKVGCYTLKIDFESGWAGLYWGPQVQTIKAKIPLSVPLICQTLRNFDGQLKKRALPAQEFLKKLYEAYRRYISLNPSFRAGDKILLIDLLQELVILLQPASFRADPTKEKFRTYSRIQFGYDLFMLKQSEQLTIGKKKLRLAVATFNATTDKTKSLWVPDNLEGDGTYYSYIAFEDDATAKD